MQLLDLFLIALMPVLKVILVTVTGLFLALDRIDVLGPNARHHLNNLVFYVFSPAIISSYLADSITLQSLISLWFMPVNILLTFIIGSALGWLLVTINRSPKQLRGIVIASCSAGNIGNLFLIILPAICEESDSPFGDSSTCSNYAEAYSSLSMAILAIYIWTYIYLIVRTSANNETRENESSDSTTIKSPGETSDTLSENLTETLLPVSEDYSDDRMKTTILEKIQQRVKTFTEKINIKKILAPSTIAAIIGLMVGIVSPIRKTLIGDSAPLRVIYSATSLLGQAAVPSITLIVGANLADGMKRAGLGTSLMIGIIVVKFIIMPVLGVIIVKGAKHFGFVESNSLYQFTLMLQYAVPPAMNIGTITQLVQTGQSECSVVMLWTYAVAIVFLTLWSAFFMWLVA